MQNCPVLQGSRPQSSSPFLSPQSVPPLLAAQHRAIAVVLGLIAVLLPTACEKPPAPPAPGPPDVEITEVIQQDVPIYREWVAQLNGPINAPASGNLPHWRVHPGKRQDLPREGSIILVSREITSQTGTIQLAAAFPNKGASLRPGGFGRIRLDVGALRNAMLIPQAAVIEVQSMYQVAVVNPDNKASFRPMKVGDRVGPDWIITEGLKPGDEVIVQGFMKVREGTPVSAKPYKASLRRRATDNVEVLHQPAHRGDRHLDLDGSWRRGGDARPADGAVSGHRRPADPGRMPTTPAPTRTRWRSRSPRPSSSRCRASTA